MVQTCFGVRGWTIVFWLPNRMDDGRAIGALFRLLCLLRVSVPYYRTERGTATVLRSQMKHDTKSSQISDSLSVQLRRDDKIVEWGKRRKADKSVLLQHRRQTSELKRAYKTRMPALKPLYTCFRTKTCGVEPACNRYVALPARLSIRALYATNLND